MVKYLPMHRKTIDRQYWLPTGYVLPRMEAQSIIQLQLLPHR
jgi:hypothetical protein